MSAGRPPKPTALKKLQGTDRSDRVLDDEMMPSLLESVPTPPPALTKGAKKEWRVVCRELLDMNMLHGVDLALLAAYCQEMSNYFDACEKMGGIEEAVTVIERPDGSEYPMMNPWFSIKNTSLKNAQSLASQFGFTPSARTRIRAQPKEDTDEFAKTFGI